MVNFLVLKNLACADMDTMSLLNRLGDLVLVKRIFGFKVGWDRSDIQAILFSDNLFSQIIGI